MPELVSIGFQLVIVAQFNFKRVFALKTKAYAPLVIQVYRILALPVADKRMQFVARWHAQVVNSICIIYHVEFSQGSLYDFWR